MLSPLVLMQTALVLAKAGQFTARPNPCVGAVIVRDNKIVGEGYHAYHGGDHAEIVALKQAGELAQGATCYVTLEPCAHHGKTPPCVDALIKAGIKKVVIAARDPNPLVAGKGIQALRENGIEVEVGLLALNAQRLNRAFMHRMEKQKPYVVMKSAMSLDGRTAMQNGESKWITGEASRQEVQLLRAMSDAIITGRGTVMADNPSLNVRDEKIVSNHYFKQPKRIVLDSRGETNGAKIYELPGESRLEKTKNLHDLLKALHEDNCNQVMVEAGATLSGAFLKENLVDEWHVFIAPKILGNSAKPLCNIDFERMGDVYGLTLTSVEMSGQDMHCIFHLR